MYSYLKCIVYDKLLKPRQSFLITLYLNWFILLRQLTSVFIHNQTDRNIFKFHLLWNLRKLTQFLAH